MEVAADRGAELPDAPDERPYGGRRRDADGVGQDDRVGLDLGHVRCDLGHAPGVDLALERATEGDAQRDGAADVVATRANGDPARRCDRVVDRGSLVALVERLRDAEREAHLVETGGEQPVVPALVQREPGADDAVRSAEGRDYLLGACHLRDAPRVDEARHLDRP